jgi:hypothetical protein
VEESLTKSTLSQTQKSGAADYAAPLFAFSSQAASCRHAVFLIPHTNSRLKKF